MLLYTKLLLAIPKPKVPDSDTTIDKGHDFAGWLAERGSSFWTLVVLGALALVVTRIFKIKFMQGMLIAGVLGVVIYLVMNKQMRSPIGWVGLILLCLFGAWLIWATYGIFSAAIVK